MNQIIKNRSTNKINKMIKEEEDNQDDKFIQPNIEPKNNKVEDEPKEEVKDTLLSFLHLLLHH